MSGNERSSSKPSEGMLDKFEPGSESGPIEDTTEREVRINQLPPGEKELALESARLADLCQYFSQEKMDIPADLLDRIGRLSRLQPGERIRELLSIIRRLRNASTVSVRVLSFGSEGIDHALRQERSRRSP